MKVAVLAGGCFWGVQELIREIPGVVESEVGYTGGITDQPRYEDVKTGTTGHAEAIKITYDPARLSFKDLLRKFFRLHDPTTKNRQGNDIGSQYRSAIFTSDAEERKDAEAVIAEAEKDWEKPITTTIEPLGPFFSAEDYHQDYLQKNPNGYTCHYWR